MLILLLSLLLQTSLYAQKHIGVFLHKNTFPSLADKQVFQATQLACLEHENADVTCHFIDLEEFCAHPHDFKDVLLQTAVWIGPRRSEEAIKLLQTCKRVFKITPPILSFSNNPSLKKLGARPIGPSPLMEIALLMPTAYEHFSHRVLVFTPRPWSAATIAAVVTQAQQGSFYFFTYDSNDLANATKQLHDALKQCSPNVFLVPFGDNTTLQLMSEALAFMTKKVGIKPLILGTSAWNDEFLNDVSLRGAIRSDIPLTTKGKKFVKTFQKLFHEKPLSVAITAYDTTHIAIEMLQNGAQCSDYTFQTCRGKIELTREGECLYEIKLQKLK
ncbi:MAG: hypothetical protein OXC30_05930 [Alphaproteobacteria bacterium]|nr:hypothetical protein [Alphaproteobacteria bacterium]